MRIADADGNVTRDPRTGLYIVGGEPMTLAQYEQGQSVLDSRRQFALMHTTGYG